MSHDNANIFEDNPEILQEFVRRFEGVLWVSAPDGRILGVGPGLEDLLGMEVDPGDRDALFRLVHPDDRPDLRDLLDDPERAPYEVEYRIVRPDGEILWLRQRGFPVGGAGSPRRVVGVIEDVTERRRDQERLAETTRFLTRTFLSLGEAVLIISGNGEGRTVLDANRAAERVFGYSKEELIGSTTEQLHASRDSYRRFDRESRAELAGNGSYEATHPMKRKDGSVFQAEQRVTLLDPDRGLSGGEVSVVRDVSEKARAEARIRESEERFRQIAERITAVFWILSLPERRIEYVSPGYEKIWGRSRQELYDDPGAWLDTVLPSDRERVEEASRFTGREYDIEYRIVRSDGEVRWIWDRAYPGKDPSSGNRRIVGLAEDITERKVAAERFALLSQEISDLIYVLGADGRVRFSTPSVSEVLGYSQEEFEGAEIFDFVHPEDREVVRDVIRSLVARPRASLKRQYRMLDVDGGVRHVEAVTQNRMDHVALQGLIVTARDITQRLKLEEQLRQSQKMEAIGRLAGGIAHDFNNLLTVIRSQSDLLLLDVDDDSETTGELQVIQQAADRAAELTSQLLSFSREQVLRPRTVGIGQVVRGMGDLLDRVIGEDVSILYDLPEDLPAVRLDPRQLGQAILNLAVNARDAMPSGGTLSFSTYRDSGSGDVVLEVSDTGRGIDEDKIDRIFDPFFTTKESPSGTGLGLSMVYGFVTQSGGTVRADSTPGEGTTFCICFPPAEGEPTPDGPPPTGVAAGEPGPHWLSAEGVGDPSAAGRILVVEDDPAVRRVTSRILERVGLDVQAVETAERALESLAEDGELRLLLTDLVLPGYSGRDLIDRVRADRPDIAIVAMSGYAAGSPGRRGELPEEIVFLQKPFTPEDLLSAIRRAEGDPTPTEGD